MQEEQHLIRAEEEQITAARAKQHEDEEEDTGIKPKELKTVFPSKHHEGIYFVNMQKNQETRFFFFAFFFLFSPAAAAAAAVAAVGSCDCALVK